MSDYRVYLIIIDLMFVAASLLWLIWRYDIYTDKKEQEGKT